MSGIALQQNVVLHTKRDIIISISLALYLFSSYMINAPITTLLGSVFLYIFLGLTFYKLITRQTPLRLAPYIFWYIAFGILGAISFFYALNVSYVLDSLYVLMVTLVVSFSFIQFAQDYSKIIRILAFCAYLPVLLIIYLIVTGNIFITSERLGETLFGNANNLGMVMMITLCCIFWFMVYGKKKYLITNILLAVSYFLVIALTGGRKFIFIPFIFLSLVLFLKAWQEKKLTSFAYLLLFAIIVFVCVWLIINVPVLYAQIGVRFEGLINFMVGNQADTSTIYRFMMVREGWFWFLENPIIGYGLNNFRVRFSDILPDASYAHNNYIEVLFDLGIIGGIIYYSFYIYIIAKLIKIRNDPTGLRNFFLAFMLALLIFEVGGVTYIQRFIQMLIALASAYLVIYKRSPTVLRYEQVFDHS